MKKAIAIILLASLLLALVGCAAPATPSAPAAQEAAPAAQEAAPAAQEAAPAAQEAAQEPAPAEEGKKWKVGITWCTSTAPSVKYAWENAEKYAEERGDIELICYDGEADATSQRHGEKGGTSQVGGNGAYRSGEAGL